jgi:HEPN domain-containing protein
MQRNTLATPDPHAVEIARAMQAETDGLVILFGSRAKGNYETASDLDILLVGHTRGKPRGAAEEYMDKNPPRLHVEVMELDTYRFRRERLANQSIASKACRHGVWMSDERVNYGNYYEDDYPEHWPATRVHLANSWENMYRLEDLVAEKSWDDKMVGFTAQQTMENGLKSLLSLHQDTAEFRHNLQGIWNHYLARHHDPSREDHQEIREVVDELMDHTSYENPQKPGERDSWLTMYAAVYRYGQETRRMPEWERQELLLRVREVFTRVMGHVSQESGTGEEDIFPDGKPWETPR